MEEKYLSTFHNMDENDIQIIANHTKLNFHALIKAKTRPNIVPGG